jgi:hypothetical protein
MNWFILAQASSSMSDFLRQVPIPLIVMFCGSGVLLLVVAFLIVRARSQRAEKAETQRSRVSAPAAAKSSDPLDADLPDLDLLVPATPPAPKPAAAPAASATTRTVRTGVYTVSLSDGDTAQAVEVVTILRDVVGGGLLVQMGNKTYQDLSRDENFRAGFLKVMRELSSVVTQAAKAPQAAAVPAAANTSVYTINLNDGGTAQAVEVVTILRDVVDGGLILQMGGKTYRDLTQDEGFRTGFLKVMRELSPMVTQAPKPAQPAPAASLRDLMSNDEAPAVDEPVEAVTPRRPAAPPPPPPTADGTMPGDLPSYSLDKQPEVVKKKGGLLGRTKTEFVPVPELNLAEAIEAYLQYKLRHTPEYAGRVIHVHPAPDGGVAIEVDGVFYEAVGDVTDADVRGFLSATIQEWQERNSRK